MMQRSPTPSPSPPGGGEEKLNLLLPSVLPEEGMPLSPSPLTGEGRGGGDRVKTRGGDLEKTRGGAS